MTERVVFPGGGYIKPAEPTDNPGELQAAMMPRIGNMATTMRLNVHRPVPCPICGEECSARPEILRQAAVIYLGRMVPLCTGCATRAHMNKPMLAAWLDANKKTADQVLAEVLTAAEGKTMTFAGPRNVQGPAEASGKSPLGPVPEFCVYCDGPIQNSRARIHVQDKDGRRQTFDTFQCLIAGTREGSERP